MGCDIHGRLQYRYGPEGAYMDAGEIERDRNYNVFAMLAGVRNGRGFAGVKTHEPLVPISAPRGLPGDIKLAEDDDTAIVLHEWRGDEQVEVRYWLGDHSHSWLTLPEIVGWDGWDKQLAMTGILDAAEFQRIERDGGSPKEWCGWISGRDVVVVGADEARASVEHTHVQYEWQVPFTTYAKTFRAWVDYLNIKHGWLLERDPAAVRIVFGFDS